MSQPSAHFRWMTLTLACLTGSLVAQTQTSQTSSVSAVPAMVKFSGTVPGAPGRLVGLTFALYKDQQGGAPLWLETQSVPVDATGHYTVQLGGTLPNGLPKELFASGEARWLGVQGEGQAEQPRVLLLSVPYALKAADAETLGGLPLSAFVVATPSHATPSGASAGSATSSASAPPPNAAVTGLGTVNSVPLWDTTTDIVNSAISQTGTGTTAKIGINTTAPTVTLDVKGTSTIRGALTLPTTGTATAATGKNSQPLNLSGSVFNSGTSTAVNQTFRLQTEPAGNNSATPSGKLNLLYYSGSNAAAETGLSIASNGRITFADGQTFPGTGTITGVTAGTALTGGGTAGTVTLNLDTTKLPLLNASNTFTGNQTVNGNLSATGAVTGSAFQIGSSLFAFGSVSSGNAFVGFSGNTSTTGNFNTANGGGALGANTAGSSNTASGSSALASNSTGNSNTANGNAALESNSTGGNNTADGSGALISSTTGSSNTATGVDALGANTTGGGNTAAGYFALVNNTTGTNNTALGLQAGPDVAHPNLTNATAIGANALVTASNALVLGSTGVNVGIGTSAPAFTLDVHGTGNFTGPVTFAAGQTFPGTGTITGVTAGTALTGGGSSGSVTLNIDTTKVITGITAGTDLIGGGTGGVQTLSLDPRNVPHLAAANTFTGNQTVNGNLSATGLITGSGYQIGSNLFASGDYSNDNVSVGFQTNLADGGANNTAVGYAALDRDTLGLSNTAIGSLALGLNSTGSSNTANGYNALEHNVGGSLNTAAGNYALFGNSSGASNTALGVNALYYNATGSNNTGLGYDAGPDSTHTSLSNATAVGAFAQVSSSNALVLGSINGVNSATASTNIGIGTTTPASTLDVEATAPGLVGPIFLLKNNAPIQSGTFGNSVDLHFALDGGSSVGNPNAYIRAAEDGSTQYGAFMSFATMADGGAGSGAIERLRITANGLVGIGVTAPTHIFQVGQGLGSAFADGWLTYSSRRWKTNIQTLPDALAKVEQLRGVSYDLKGSGKHEIGVIAEEVGQVVPEVVSFEANGKDAQGVDYSRLTAVLIEAVKEQQRQIQEQNRQIRMQQRQIARLNGKVGLLESGLVRKAGVVRKKLQPAPMPVAQPN